MKATLVICVLALLAGFAMGQEKRGKQTIPARAYHVISHVLHQGGRLPEIVGRIPQSEGLTIEVSADAIKVENAVTLTGNAAVTVSVNGKAMATYEGTELVLTPVAKAAAPLTYEECNLKANEFDHAIAKRDIPAVLAFFAEDAKISAQFLTSDRVVTKTYTPQEYGEYLKNVFPSALRITADWNYDGREQSESPGNYLQVSKDGLTAAGWSNVRFTVTVPEGQVIWRQNRQITVEKRGERFVITTLEISLPKSLSGNWPETPKPTPTRPAPLVPQPARLNNR
jgi:hypothetical protein